MLTRRLTTTLRCARRLAPVERLIVTIGGSSCGVSPTAIASANKAASSSERPSTMLTTRIVPEHERDAHQQQREVTQPELERGLRLAVPEAPRDRPELRASAGLHDHTEPAALAHHGAHERARGQLERRLRR
jgi:hypothetical protein